MDTAGIRAEVMEEIIKTAQNNKIKKLIIFGSRARGDFKETSDIDIAVSGGDFDVFVQDMEETSTLLKFDLIDLDGPIENNLLESIRREGRIIYEEI